MNNTEYENPVAIEHCLPASEGDWPCFYEHSLLESAVTEAARELQVSREMAMMCAFGAMATACQGHVTVKMPTGRLAPTSLMLLTIADSGERKTTTQNYFFEAIHSLNDAAYQASKIAATEHRVTHQLWNTRKRHLERMYSKYAAQGDEVATQTTLDAIAEHVRAEPQVARSDKFLYDDTTPQALVQMLYENMPNGCLLTSEANSIFSGKALGELDKLNTLWDGGSVIVDRVSREGFVLQNARLTLSLMAQPSVITRFMEKRGEEARGTGFLARFLVAKPRQMAGQRRDSQLSALPSKDAFNARIRECFNSATTPVRHVLYFSETAANLWRQYSMQLEQEMREYGYYHYLKDHASKILENTTRLAAILHMFERPSERNMAIGQRTLEFCWAFTRACSKHFIEHLATEPQLITDTNRLAHFLIKKADKEDIFNGSASQKHFPRETRNTNRPSHLKPGARATFTLTEIKQYGPSNLRGRANSERLTAAIELLTKIGHIIKQGNRYHFQETIILKYGVPELKNGETLKISELPLFREQTYWRPERTNGSRSAPGYFIEVNQ